MSFTDIPNLSRVVRVIRQLGMFEEAYGRYSKRIDRKTSHGLGYYCYFLLQNFTNMQNYYCVALLSNRTVFKDAEVFLVPRCMVDDIEPEYDTVKEVSYERQQRNE
jgi:hypothetical protein